MLFESIFIIYTIEGAPVLRLHTQYAPGAIYSKFKVKYSRKVEENVYVHSQDWESNTQPLGSETDTLTDLPPSY